MDAWLISWTPAGRNFVDQVVAILPDHYEPPDVEKILEALFHVGSFTVAETVNIRSGFGVRPEIYASTHANDYTRLIVSHGSFALEARRVRELRVLDEQLETISWQEQNHDGTWSEESFRRKHRGTITFDIE